MVRFHVPSLTIDSGDLVEGQGRIAGHQILNARTAIFVCEDLLDQQERETDTFQVDVQRGIRVKAFTASQRRSSATDAAMFSR